MSLTDKQHAVLKGMIAGAVITVVVIVGAIFIPVDLPPYAFMGQRIAYALKMDVLIALWLAVSVGLLARHRFFTPEDIDGSGLTPGTGKAHILQANLQNTLEQSVLAVLTHVIWAVVMPLAAISVIRAAVLLFLLGRLFFLRGYGRGAQSRALGFTLTFYPSILMLLMIAGTLIFGRVL